MTHDAHNVGLVALLINSIAHSFAVHCKTFVFFGVGFVPALQGAVKMYRINADKNIADDVFAWNDITSVFVAASKSLPGLLTEAFGPILDSLISTHPAQDCSGCNGQNSGQSMAASLGSTGIVDIGKKVGQRFHLFGG